MPIGKVYVVLNAVDRISGEPRFRVQVTYRSGAVRFLAPSFKAMAKLDAYMERWHPNLTACSAFLNV